MEVKPQEQALTSPHPHPPNQKKKLHTGWSDIRITTEGALSRLIEAASLLHGFIAQYMSPSSIQHQRGISKLMMCRDRMLQRVQAWCGHCLVFWLGLSCGPFWSTPYIDGCFICSHQQHHHFSLHSTSWYMVYITRYMTSVILPQDLWLFFLK